MSGARFLVGPCHRQQVQREGHIHLGFKLETHPLGPRENVVRDHSAAGNQRACRLLSHWNVEQTMSVEMTEFSPFFSKKLYSTESVDPKSNIRQA